MLNNIDRIYAGLRDIIASKGLSVQAQNTYPLRTAIDQRGEQSLNKSAKTSGGVKHFALNPSSVK